MAEREVSNKNKDYMRYMRYMRHLEEAIAWCVDPVNNFDYRS